MTRAHPFTDGTLVLAVVALALLLPTWPATAALYLATCAVALVVGAGTAVRLGIVISLPLWVLLGVMHVILGEGPRAPFVLGGSYALEGLDWALHQGTRLAAIVTASLAFAARFDAHRFLQAAIARGWPFTAAFVLVATLDAADRFGAQAVRLREAQRTRGLKVRGSIGARLRAIPALAFPLMLAALTEADDRALALESRGLTRVGPRTALDPPPDRAADRLARWGAFAVVIAVLAWRFAR
ncbi:MAG TPA: energy-coupling factor transporter transmembrane component T [Gemmatimonadales bacterium]|nr:energy-coupling factor transporter transmembrane component T [Gemmatimonadales bacterium]